MAGKLPETPNVLLAGPYVPVITGARLHPATVGARCMQPPPIGGRWTPCVASPIRGRWTPHRALHCGSRTAETSAAPGTIGRRRCRCITSPSCASGCHALVLSWKVCSGWGINDVGGRKLVAATHGGMMRRIPTAAPQPYFCLGFSGRTRRQRCFAMRSTYQEGEIEVGGCINKYSMI